MAKEERFKTVSFGGYEKAAVDTYIENMKQTHKQDIADLKQTISKLSETVKSLQLVKDSMSSENNQAIEDDNDHFRMSWIKLIVSWQNRRRHLRVILTSWR